MSKLALKSHFEELKHNNTGLLFMISCVLKYGSDCEGVVIAASRRFNVQVCEGKSDLVALWHTEVPLLLQVGRVRLRILGGLDHPMH